MVIKLYIRIFTVSATPPSLVIFFVTRMLTRDQFAVVVSVIVDIAINLSRFVFDRVYNFTDVKNCYVMTSLVVKKITKALLFRASS